LLARARQQLDDRRIGEPRRSDHAHERARRRIDLPHTGCGKFVGRFGIDAQKLVNSKVGRELNLRGINAKVVRAGTVHAGDAIRPALNVPQ
jgi:hypothetical protein